MSEKMLDTKAFKLGYFELKLFLKENKYPRNGSLSLGDRVETVISQM